MLKLFNVALRSSQGRPVAEQKATVLHRRLIASLPIVLWAAAVSCFADDADFSAQVQPILQQRCGACHGADQQEGGVDFSKIADQHAAQASYPLWKKALSQVNAGSMPPAGETPLTEAEKQKMTEWYRATFDTSQNPDPGPALTRQMTRHEYGQTLRDLLRYG